MRYLYLLSLALVAEVVQGQTIADTLRVTAPQARGEVVRRVTSTTDSTGLCTETLSWGEASGLVRTYYSSGRLKEYVPYADLGAGHLHGLVTTWYESGQLASRQPFVKGERDGALELYYENGQLRRQANYVAGAELPGRCFDTAGVAMPYFPYEQLPLYPGGQMQLAKEINKAMRWPPDVPVIIGPDFRTVCISFWVDKDGSIRQPRVAVSSQFPSLDRAVLNTVHKLARRFAPARRDGLVVQSKYYLPIRLGRATSFSRPGNI
jgi:protein TonB